MHVNIRRKYEFISSIIIDHCNASLPSCENGGLRNHKCECYCPAGLTGSLCETIITDQGNDIKRNKK